MRYTVDRFEEAFAVLEAEDGTMLQVKRAELPPDTAEGSMLILADGIWQTTSSTETAQRIRSKMDTLWK